MSGPKLLCSVHGAIDEAMISVCPRCHRDLRAENQRLRDALERILANRSETTIWTREIADEALFPKALFPPGCKCPSYGHGLTMTRVNAPYCPIHGSREALAGDAE